MHHEISMRSGACLKRTELNFLGLTALGCLSNEWLEARRIAVNIVKLPELVQKT
jgi:hypothetical protein